MNVARDDLRWRKKRLSLSLPFLFHALVANNSRNKSIELEILAKINIFLPKDRAPRSRSGQEEVYEGGDKLTGLIIPCPGRI